MTDEAPTLPRISIIIPSFRQPLFLQKALDSLVAQDYPNLEVIVVDGGGSDDVRELLAGRKDVTHWLSEPDNGQTHALNKGFSIATGDILGWLNCDERYRPGTLKQVAESFRREPELEIVFGHRIVVDEAGKEIGRSRIPAIHPGRYALFAGGLLFSDATFWAAKLHRRTGKLDELNCPKYGMDYDWFARMGMQAKRWKRIDAYLSEFTEYAGRVSYNVPTMPQISLSIKKRLQKLSGVGPIRVMLFSPLYFIRSRYGRFGLKGLLRPPSARSLLRVAGLAK